MRHRSPWRRTAPLFFLAVSSVTGILGCDSGTSTPGGMVTSPTSLSVSLAQAFCVRQACCAGISPGSADAGADGGSSSAPADSCLADNGGIALDAAAVDGGPASCLQKANLAVAEQLALLSTAAAEGLVTLNPAAAATCVTAYQNQACTDAASPSVQAALEGCSGVFTGYVPVGERCDMTAECVAGTFCLSQATGTNQTSLMGSGSLGVCFPYTEVGGVCNTTSDCDPTTMPALVCDTSSFTCQSPS
jgi:hypothetical protein